MYALKMMNIKFQIQHFLKVVFFLQPFQNKTSLRLLCFLIESKINRIGFWFLVIHYYNVQI